MGSPRWSAKTMFVPHATFASISFAIPHLIWADHGRVYVSAFCFSFSGTARNIWLCTFGNWPRQTMYRKPSSAVGEFASIPINAFTLFVFCGHLGRLCLLDT